MVRSAPIAWLTRRLLAFAMLVLASSPHLASAAEAVSELNAERPVACCPAHPPETPDPPDPTDDCSRTCRSCHCCLPIAWFDAALPEVVPAPPMAHEELLLTTLGGDLPAHTRSLFRPPAV